MFRLVYRIFLQKNFNLSLSTIKKKGGEMSIFSVQQYSWMNLHLMRASFFNFVILRLSSSDSKLLFFDTLKNYWYSNFKKLASIKRRLYIQPYYTIQIWIKFFKNSWSSIVIAEFPRQLKIMRNYQFLFCSVKKEKQLRMHPEKLTDAITAEKLWNIPAEFASHWTTPWIKRKFFATWGICKGTSTNPL